jgi:hypothetical protein
MYRFGDDVNAEGWPFLFERHAYLADGTPLTEYDDDGRVVPTGEPLEALGKICSAGHLTLADRRSGIDALARAVDKGDVVRAPILLLLLQIDPVPAIAKYNPFHKPDGPGGGQFTHNPYGGGAITPVEWSLHVGFNSTFVPDPNHPEFTIVHALVMALVHNAILQITTPTFGPGMPDYGRKLHDAVAAEIIALNHPGLVANPVYLEGKLYDGKVTPPGSSVPDIVYTVHGAPVLVFELKTGKRHHHKRQFGPQQRLQTLRNMPFSTRYEYIQVYGVN